MPMPYKFITIITTAIYVFISSSVHADCKRDDIEFYLDKGFTQAQITELCSATKSTGDTTPDYTPYQQKVIIYKQGGEDPGIKDGLTREEREAVSTIKAGGDVAKLKVTPETISYTAQTCVVSANTPDFEQRYKDCIEVDFVILRENLEVSASGKKLLLFGNPYILLEGTIDAKPKRPWEDYPISVRKALQRNFEWKENGKKTPFPVISDYSTARLVGAFRTLGETYGQADNENQVAEASSEEIKEVVREPKEEKKKRWWNPFD